MTVAFWRGRRVFVTGHTGFKGSWLCLWLQRLGADVAGYSLPASTQPNLFEAARVDQGMTTHHGDIGDAELLAARMLEHQPEIVVHLAAQPLVRRSYEAPLQTYGANVLGTANLLQAVRRTSTVRAAIVITSDKCYDLRAKRERYAEDDALGGHDPYSASKAGAENIVAGYRMSFWGGAPVALTAIRPPAVATARSGNVIGGGDWSQDRLVPDLIAAFGANAAARIRQPDAVRPWQHVLDPIRGYLTLAEKLAAPDGAVFAEAWNFGPPAQNEQSVSVIADEVATLWGHGAAWERDSSQHPLEAVALRLDCTKADRRLGWRGTIALHAALERTVSWHKAFAGGADARALVDADIDEFALHAVRS